MTCSSTPQRKQHGSGHLARGRALFFLTICGLMIGGKISLECSPALQNISLKKKAKVIEMYIYTCSMHILRVIFQGLFRVILEGLRGWSMLYSNDIWFGKKCHRCPMFHNDALLTLEIYRTGLEMPQKLSKRWGGPTCPKNHHLKLLEFAKQSSYCLVNTRAQSGIIHCGEGRQLPKGGDL